MVTGIVSGELLLTEFPTETKLERAELWDQGVIFEFGIDKSAEFVHDWMIEQLELSPRFHSDRVATSYEIEGEDSSSKLTLMLELSIDLCSDAFQVAVQKLIAQSPTRYEIKIGRGPGFELTFRLHLGPSKREAFFQFLSRKSASLPVEVIGVGASEGDWNWSIKEEDEPGRFVLRLNHHSVR